MDQCLFTEIFNFTWIYSFFFRNEVRRIADGKVFDLLLKFIFFCRYAMKEINIRYMSQKER
jgi:hypothetical protein